MIHQSGNCLELQVIKDFPHGPVVKNLPCGAGHVGSIPDRELRFHMRQNN